jgi:hypothetical protein
VSLHFGYSDLPDARKRYILQHKLFVRFQIGCRVVMTSERARHANCPDALLCMLTGFSRTRVFLSGPAPPPHRRT